MIAAMSRWKHYLYWALVIIANVVLGGIVLLFIVGMFLTSFWAPPRF